MSESKTNPWYKQFWPWFLIALPATAVVGALTCVVIAFKNQDAVVRDNWDEDSKKVNVEVNREHAAQAQNLVASVLVDDNSLNVNVILKSDKPQNDAKLDLRISHPTDPSRDQDVPLVRGADGSYSGKLKSPLMGRYYLDIEASTWRLQDLGVFPSERFDIHPM